MFHVHDSALSFRMTVGSPRVRLYKTSSLQGKDCILLIRTGRGSLGGSACFFIRQKAEKGRTMRSNLVEQFIRFLSTRTDTKQACEGAQDAIVSPLQPQVSLMQQFHLLGKWLGPGQSEGHRPEP